MYRLVTLVKSAVWNLAVRGHRSPGAAGDASGTGQCPARIFCLGCDGNINCSLARSVVHREGA